MKLLIKGAEAALPTGSGSASNFDNATVVRLVNTVTNADHLVTVVETQGGTVVGSFTLMRSESVLLEKQSGHFVFAANTLSEGSNTIKKILDEDLSDINTHETMGTHNRVISLGSSYLEVIALDPKNQNANNNTWFNLSDKIYREKFLKIPKLISFVISSEEFSSSIFFEKEFLVSRNKYKWFFKKPNFEYLNKNNFTNTNLFPSLINWQSVSPLNEMKKSSYSFDSLEITLNKNHKLLKDFLLSLNLKEKIIFNFNDSLNDELLSLKLTLKSSINGKYILIS